MNASKHALSKTTFDTNKHFKHGSFAYNISLPQFVEKESINKPLLEQPNRLNNCVSAQNLIKQSGVATKHTKTDYVLIKS